MQSMTTVETRIADLIATTLRELAEQGVVEFEDSPVSWDTQLFGEAGLLDSVGLVSLVVAVEERLADDLGIDVALADERALSQRQSPYRTVSSLASYAARLAPGG